MNRNGNMKGKSSSSPISKRSRPDSAGSTQSTPQKTSCCTEVSEILMSIDSKLTGLETRIALIEVLHNEFKSLRDSLEFSQQQIETLTKENKSLQTTVQNLTTQLTTITTENKAIKESILDLQARSMRDNLIFSGIPEADTDTPEKFVQDFMITQLKIHPETAKNITFHRVHRLGGKKVGNNRPRPIVAKFEHYKHKELVQKQGRQLKGTNFGMNDQYPREILDRRKRLFPIRKQLISEGKKATISVDKLYVNGQLYRDREVTPWLF